MTEQDLTNGTVVTHFKRELLTDKDKGTKYCYEIISVAEHTESGEKLVIYRALYGDFRVYARPIGMFLSETDKEKYPDVKQEFRFEKLS